MMASHSCADNRRAVLMEAQRWIGTPYRHQSRTCGVGTDCLGLIIGIWSALYGYQPDIPSDYAIDWAVGCSAGDDPLHAAATHHCRTIAVAQAMPGDLLTMRWMANQPSRHLAIVGLNETIIHAYERHGVIVSTLVPFWRRRISGAFVFPLQNFL